MLENTTGITPILKWPGGKSGELNIILSRIPSQFDSYFEPFLGGGAVFLSVPSSVPAFVNDISKDLINLYQNIASNEPAFFDLLDRFVTSWRALQSFVEHYSDYLLHNYRQFSDDKLSDYDFREKLCRFVDQNDRILRELLSPGCDYDEEHFIREVKASLFSKTKRMRKLERKKARLPDADILSNIEGALKAAFYTHLRHLYNYSSKYRILSAHQGAIFFFIRENAYASMFRFNRSGKFNIPYGGITYNRKNLDAKIERMKDPLLVERFATATFGSLDFEEFLEKHPPQSRDFVFLDPPYDSDFSEYDQNEFGRRDQERLARYLIHKCKARFMLVIKATEFIQALYEGKGLNISAFDKKYMYTVKERNNRDSVHLMIRNYSEGIYARSH